MSEFILIGQDPTVTLPSFMLKSGRVTLGRSPKCELIVKNLSVSRWHAALTIDGGAVTIADLGSRNGTFVNNERISERAAHVGCLVRFGSALFLLADEQLAAAELFKSTEPVSEAEEAFDSRIGKLSKVKRRVLLLLLEGLSEPQVAERLYVSQHTVHNHVRAIYSAAHVSSRAGLLAMFLQRNGKH